MPQPRAIVPDNGGIRAGLNATGAAIPKYRIVRKGTSVVDSVAPHVDGAAPAYGVSMAEIPNGYAGDVQIKGRAIVQASEPITIGQTVTGAAGGKAAVAAAGEHALGIAASPAAADNDLFEVDLFQGVNTPA